VRRYYAQSIYDIGRRKVTKALVNYGKRYKNLGRVRACEVGYRVLDGNRIDRTDMV